MKALITSFTILTILFGTKISTAGCKAEFDCSDTVVISCTGSSSCTALSCIYVECDGVRIEIGFDTCPLCSNGGGENEEID